MPVASLISEHYSPTPFHATRFHISLCHHLLVPSSYLTFDKVAACSAYAFFPIQHRCYKPALLVITGTLTTGYPSGTGTTGMFLHRSTVYKTNQRIYQIPDSANRYSSLSAHGSSGCLRCSAAAMLATFMRAFCMSASSSASLCWGTH